jgi:uncharacterized LabA/DUF88 family protein
MSRSNKNLAFIDGQNLYMGTTSSDVPWKVDLAKFMVYPRKKYGVVQAYYFLGYVQERNEELYEKIQQAGMILVFRQHSSAMFGKKKGNVDSDIIFQVMKRLYKKDDFDKIVLVSGDGDYKIMVEFLIEEGRFEKALFPNRKFASSLYRDFDYFESEDVRKKISLANKKEKGSLGS